MTTVSIVYPKLIDICCYSHTLNHVGEKFNVTLSVISSLWISLFSHSHKTRKDKTGKTRWWSRWEVLHQILQQFSDVMSFLQENSDIGPAIRPKLLEILTDVQRCNLLKTELAVVIDLA